MTELVDWLRQQLDEDERVALAAHANVWNAEASRHDSEFVIVPDFTPSGVGVVFGAKNAQHIANWDPARVLAEVEAKRRILDEHPHEPAAPWGTAMVTSVGCATCHDRGEGVIGKGWCRTARLLAQPYAGRPGWREEWSV